MKMKWALDWMNKKCSFVEKLVAFALVESLFFQTTFAGIFYFRERNTLTGLCHGNTLVMRDENSHYSFAVYLYNNYIENKLSDEKLKEMVVSCLETELTFVDNIMPDGLLGLSKEMMKNYCRYIADTILINFGSTSIFNVEQPLRYMEKLAIPRKTNFFEKRPPDYTRADSAEMDITLEDF
jgi:ribonucleoside-diphosphate reductase beta chain